MGKAWRCLASPICSVYGNKNHDPSIRISQVLHFGDKQKSSGYVYTTPVLTKVAVSADGETTHVGSVSRSLLLSVLLLWMNCTVYRV